MREALHAALHAYKTNGGTIEDRNIIRQLLIIYKKTITAERSPYYFEITSAIDFPNERMTLIMDGASQE